MERIKKLCSVALAALVLGGIGLTPAEAVYKPKNVSKMGGQHKKEVQNVVTYLKGLQKSARWDFIAERLGLMFMPPNGENGHDPKDSHGYSKEGAHFIGADGLEYDAKSEIKVAPSLKEWIATSDMADRLGREAIFVKMASEVTAIVVANAKYHLEKIAEARPECRDMYLAYIAKLCYLPEGNSPYGKVSTKNGPHRQPIQYYEIRNKDCKFIDTAGVERSFDEVYRQYTELGGDRWEILNICTHHVGAKDILALYPKEVKKLRANYEKRMKELQK